MTICERIYLVAMFPGLIVNFPNNIGFLLVNVLLLFFLICHLCATSWSICFFFAFGIFLFNVFTGGAGCYNNSEYLKL